MRVLVAVDSFKGTISAPGVARAIGEGWLTVRPRDVLDEVALADGGEGTAEVLAAAVPGSRAQRVPGVTGPDGSRVIGEWFELPGGIAVVDLAQMSGLPLMRTPSPLTATTRGLGQTIRAALAAGASEVWIGLGGSASTDGGMGALRALGLRAVDARGGEIAEGGAGLSDLVAVDAGGLVPIPGGVTLFSDVVSPLTGVLGAAAVFGPQKGANSQDVALLDANLTVLAAVLGLDPTTPGSGAAGGAGYGFAAVYGATIVSGADRVADLTGLDQRIAAADLVITGEGAFDSQSRKGKVVGNVLRRAHRAGVPAAVVAGAVHEDPGVRAVSLTELAGGPLAAMRAPAEWTRAAGAALARAWPDS